MTKAAAMLDSQLFHSEIHVASITISGGFLRRPNIREDEQSEEISQSPRPSSPVFPHPLAQD